MHAGKGDLVGCDISMNLLHNGLNSHSGGGQVGIDIIMKSSSDVKVSISRFDCRKSSSNLIPITSTCTGFNLL